MTGAKTTPGSAKTYFCILTDRLTTEYIINLINLTLIKKKTRAISRNSCRFFGAPCVLSCFVLPCVCHVVCHVVCLVVGVCCVCEGIGTIRSKILSKWQSIVAHLPTPTCSALNAQRPRVMSNAKRTLPCASCLRFVVFVVR